MNEQWKAIAESKRRERARLTALPFSEKVALLEKLRDRALATVGNALYRPHEPADGKAWILRERPRRRSPRGAAPRN